MTTSFNPQPSRQITNSQHAEKMLRNNSKKWDTSVCIQRSPIKTDQLTGWFQNEPPCDDVLHILTIFLKFNGNSVFRKILKNWKFWNFWFFPLKINLNQLFEHPNEFQNFREHSEPETIIFNRIIFKEIVMRSKNLNFFRAFF